MAGISPDIGDADRPAGDMNGDGVRSPRKGGDRAGGRDHGLHQEYIPAYAGGTSSFLSWTPPRRVYPRVRRGGNQTVIAVRSNRDSLSPHRRGIIRSDQPMRG